jgi:hypothetical protein
MWGRKSEMLAQMTKTRALLGRSRLLPGLGSTAVGARRVATAALILLSSCKVPESGVNPDSYIENGQIWAYGSVQLTHLEGPGVVVIERLKADQSFDSAAAAQTGSERFQLTGALQAAPGAGDNGRRDLAYVDLHPSSDRLLAYAWSLEVRPRSGRENIVDVSALLRKPGRTFVGYRRIHLGEAAFRADENTAQMTLRSGIKLSLIADGVYQGQWALHYPDVRMVDPPNFAGFCRGSVSQIPGQLPNQNPGQRVSCRPMPSQIDLCGGSPLGESCRPRPPVQQAGDAFKPQVEGLEPVVEASSIFATREDSSGKLLFVAEGIESTDATNAELCASRFYTLARTEGEQVNPACIIKAAPALSANGKLACAVTVTFENAQTYLEKICNVTGLFVGSDEPPRTVQVLKQ